MRAAIFAIATAIAAVFFTSDIVGFRPLKGEERPSTVVGLFEQSPVPYDKAFVERHGLGDGEADEVLCERRTSFVLGGRRWESSPAGHVVVCQFRVTNDPGSRDPSSHPYAYFFRGSRWRLAEGEGLGAASGPTRKLVNWPLYWLGNGLILAALLVTLRFVRAHLLKGRRHSDRPTKGALAVSLTTIWVASACALLLWALTAEHPASSQILYHIQPEVLLGSLLIAPLLEELLFRGLIQECFQEVLAAWAAIGVAALVFALAHDATLGSLISLFLSGVLFGWIRYWSGSITLAIAVHGLTNVVIVGVQLMSAATA